MHVWHKPLVSHSLRLRTDCKSFKDRGAYSGIVCKQEELAGSYHLSRKGKLHVEVILRGFEYNESDLERSRYC